MCTLHVRCNCKHKLYVIDMCSCVNGYGIIVEFLIIVELIIMVELQIMVELLMGFLDLAFLTSKDSFSVTFLKNCYSNFFGNYKFTFFREVWLGVSKGMLPVRYYFFITVVGSMQGYAPCEILLS